MLDQRVRNGAQSKKGHPSRQAREAGRGSTGLPLVTMVAGCSAGCNKQGMQHVGRGDRAGNPNKGEGRVARVPRWVLTVG